MEVLKALSGMPSDACRVYLLHIRFVPGSQADAFFFVSLSLPHLFRSSIHVMWVFFNHLSAQSSADLLLIPVAIADGLKFITVARQFTNHSPFYTRKS